MRREARWKRRGQWKRSKKCSDGEVEERKYNEKRNTKRTQKWKTWRRKAKEEIEKRSKMESQEEN